MKRLGISLIFIGCLIVSIFSIKVFRQTNIVNNNNKNDSKLNIEGINVEVKSKYEYLEKEKDRIKVMSNQLNIYSEGEEMAKLIIPKIEQIHPVFWGTSDRTLDKGVGIYVSEWTVTPDFLGHVVLSGHRDTNFTELGELKLGDIIKLDYKDKVYIYEIDDIWITNPDDLTVIIDKDEAVLTLTTCYPFKYIGAAPDRYIVQAKLIK